MSQIPDSAFRAYDIRGTVAGPDGSGGELDVPRVRALGRALGTYFLENGADSALVGHDCRHSSPAFHDALVEGLCSTGVNVTGIGMVPTPALYFATAHLGRAAGVMITASHNPPEYNGFKIVLNNSTIHTHQIRHVADILTRGEFARGRGTADSIEIIPDYINAITSRFTLKRPLRVVVDGGNGAGGLICAEVLRRMGAEVIELNCVPDGDFPAHHPDPVVPENMRQCIDAVKEHGADIGIGLDGDADRIAVADAAGRLLFGDELLSLFARELLLRKPGSLILADVKSSQRLFDDIKAHGGRAEMWITGHSVMKARMRETHAELAGEMSGHMFFVDRWYGFDDGIHAAARLLELLSGLDTPLTALPGWPAAVATPEIQIPCPEGAKPAVIEQARAWLRERFETNELDGARATVPGGWLLVRASNTQPVLTLRYEAESEARVAELRAMLEPPLRVWIEEASQGGPA